MVKDDLKDTVLVYIYMLKDVLSVYISNNKICWEFKDETDITDLQNS